MSNEILSKSMTFDLEKNESEYLNIIRILYSTPRLYEDLVDSLELCFKGTRKNLDKLVKYGFVSFQKEIIVDTISGETKSSVTKPVKRYILGSLGKKKLLKYKEDIAFFNSEFKKIEQSQTIKVLQLLDELNLEMPHSRYGLSVNHLSIITGLPSRTVRWWVEVLVKKGYVVELITKYADTRALVPGHYRINKEFSKQLNLVVNSYNTERNINLLNTLKIKRNKYLDDVKIARVGINGATDYEHDIDTQRIISKFIKSGNFIKESLFEIEPRINLNVYKDGVDYIVSDKGNQVMFYQPDATYKEKNSLGATAKTVLEYERFQSRKDGWEHIEKFIGYMFQYTLPFEKGILRFVVDGQARERTYVKLIEAYTDSVLDSSELLPRNPLTIMVSTLEKILISDDALLEDIWYKIDLPSGKTDKPKPKVHSGDGPYKEYFSRGRQW